MAVSLAFERLQRWDVAGFHLISIDQQNCVFDLLMPFITEKWNFLAPLILVCIYLILYRSRKDLILAISAVALVFLANTTTQIIKDLIQRIRPCHIFEPAQLLYGSACTDSFSFPSSHASNIFAVAAFLSYNYRILTIPAFFSACVVGYSRIYLGAHYPTDVFAGAAWGMLLGFTAAVAVRRLMRFPRTGVQSGIEATKGSLAFPADPPQ